jgi:hypothetical protein
MSIHSRNSVNVELSLHKIQELVETLSPEPGDTITWDKELHRKREMAEKALEVLHGYFSISKDRILNQTKECSLKEPEVDNDTPEPEPES